MNLIISFIIAIFLLNPWYSHADVSQQQEALDYTNRKAAALKRHIVRLKEAQQKWAQRNRPDMVKTTKARIIFRQKQLKDLENNIAKLQAVDSKSVPTKVASATPPEKTAIPATIVSNPVEPSVSPASAPNPALIAAEKYLGTTVDGMEIKHIGVVDRVEEGRGAVVKEIKNAPQASVFNGDGHHIYGFIHDDKLKATPLQPGDIIGFGMFNKKVPIPTVIDKIGSFNTYMIQAFEKLS